MNKIVIFGEFDSDNVGDVLIGLGQKFVYNSSDLNVETLPFELSVRSNNKKNTQESIGFIKSTHRKLYKNSFYYRHVLEFLIFIINKRKYLNHAGKSIGNSDCIVIGGGQVFNDNSLRMILRIFCLIEMAMFHKKDVYIIGSGVPTPKTFISRIFISKIFSKLNKGNIFLRDAKSKNIINEITKLELNHNNIIPDFAISYVSSFADEYHSINKKIGLSPISIGCIPKEQKNLKFNQDSWWLGLSKYLISKGIEPVLFCSGTKEDYERCNRIKDHAYSEGLNLSIDIRPECPNTFLELLKGYDNVVTQRLHVSISTYALGKLPLSLPWDEKVECFYNEVGLQSHFIADDAIEYSYILEKLYETNIGYVHPKLLISKMNKIVTSVFKV